MNILLCFTITYKGYFHTQTVIACVFVYTLICLPVTLIIQYNTIQYNIISDSKFIQETNEYEILHTVNN